MCPKDSRLRIPLHCHTCLYRVVITNYHSFLPHFLFTQSAICPQDVTEADPVEVCNDLHVAKSCGYLWVFFSSYLNSPM